MAGVAESRAGHVRPRPGRPDRGQGVAQGQRRQVETSGSSAAGKVRRRPGKTGADGPLLDGRSSGLPFAVGPGERDQGWRKTLCKGAGGRQVAFLQGGLRRAKPRRWKTKARSDKVQLKRMEPPRSAEQSCASRFRASIARNMRRGRACPYSINRAGRFWAWRALVIVRSLSLRHGRSDCSCSSCNGTWARTARACNQPSGVVPMRSFVHRPPGLGTQRSPGSSCV
mmetsp:Transcript_369/g.2873  ORF Transcript_369/g.2873 Transcript_369/m.2873 type:complete len:226 (+) Transcript_369:1127-1804(+)